MSKMVLLATAVLALVMATVSTPAWANPATAPGKTLAAFTSEEELAELFKGWAEEARRLREEEARRSAAVSGSPPPPPPPAPPPPATVSESPSSRAAEADSITNVQHAGVDEGGIVKLYGEHLVVLRRGRLFTIRVADRHLKPIASADAFGPGIDPRGAWYDEMLISGNTIAVIGFSYARGGTELGLFELSDAGQLTYKGTYHLRSNDYYSSRNYASRLIGTKLIFYSPLLVNPWGGDPFAAFPAMRKWQPAATLLDFTRTAPATRIYRSAGGLDPRAGIVLHSVTICDLATPELECDSTAVLGPPGRVFYVSPTTIFVWTTAWRLSGQGTAAPSSQVFRIPLDGSAPSALKVAGSPVDQFSFLEGEDGMLNVLVRSSGRGDGMWAAELSSGDLALLRIPLESFSDGRDSAPPGAYRALPKPSGPSLQNRFVGTFLLYGAGTGWSRPQVTAQPQIYAVRYADDGAMYGVPLIHAVDRIEALGANAIVVGSDGKNLHLTSLRLTRFPVAVDRYTREDTAQGESRSHGFYYKRESEHNGLLGLPIVRSGEPVARQLWKESAAIIYVRNRNLSLSELGTLEARPGMGERNDDCRASCVDWYGNSRPLFLRGRVFALMGYEIVEGTVTEKRIVETQRVSFAPQSDAYSQ